MSSSVLNSTPLSITPGTVKPGSTGVGSNVALDRSGAPLPGYGTLSAFAKGASASASSVPSAGTTAATTLVNPLIAGFLSKPAPAAAAVSAGSASSTLASASASAGAVTTSSSSAVTKAGGTSSNKPDTDFTFIVFIEPLELKAINNGLKQQNEKNDSGAQWDDG